jgi:hypothetical protein
MSDSKGPQLPSKVVLYEDHTKAEDLPADFLPLFSLVFGALGLMMRVCSTGC